MSQTALNVQSGQLTTKKEELNHQYKVERQNVAGLNKEKEKEQKLRVAELNNLELQKTQLGSLVGSGSSLDESFIRDLQKIELELLDLGLSKEEFDKRMREAEIENLKLRIAAKQKFNQDSLELELELARLSNDIVEKTGDNYYDMINDISIAITKLHNDAADNAIAAMKRQEDAARECMARLRN
jgi:hypothetical protein